jgi:hypothetical protein
MRWLNGVDRHNERLGERKWRRQARNKDEWEKLLRKARAQLVLLSQ